MLGDPQTWLAMGAWVFFVIGAIRLGWRFWDQGRYGFLVGMAIAFVAFIGVYIWLFRHTFGMLVQGAPDPNLFLLLRIMSWTVLAFSIATIVWIARDSIGERSP
ncbi:hypothetical protein FIU90_10895 [Erythrobacter sp. THAF29]|nr:hypothetical protein FIU90_10895 [Erythrobacter sp. THAF29]